MAYFKDPFTKKIRNQFNRNWLSQHIFRKANNPNLKPIILDQLKRSGYKREFIDIDRVENVSAKDFYKNYFLSHKPVVFSGAAKEWPALSWSLEYFEKEYGDKDTVNTNVGALDVISLAQTIKDIRSGKSEKARLCKILTHHPELMEQNDLSIIQKYIPKLSYTTSYQFFIGTKGNFTPLHAGATNNFQVQVSGEKTWHLIDPIFNPVINPQIDREPLFKSQMNTEEPDFDRYPEQAYMPIIRVHLKPGDILYNPTFYWHQVQYQSESMAIGLRSLNLYSMFKGSATMATVLATATNPPAIYSFYNISKGITRPFFR